MSNKEFFFFHCFENRMKKSIMLVNNIKINWNLKCYVQKSSDFWLNIQLLFYGSLSVNKCFFKANQTLIYFDFYKIFEYDCREDCR